jgi:mannose-6-phosphate isomerase
MLVPLSNSPRPFAWGSTTLLAELEGRTPSGAPEAEVWFGDHPGSPARTPDGRALDAWLAAPPAGVVVPDRLPYLLKLLAAASPLSIQAHPTRAQAAAGFTREEAAGIAVDAPERTYRDANHKPELIVAVSEEFRALAGLRDPGASIRLLETLGAPAVPLIERLRTDGAHAVVGWVLSADAAPAVAAIIDVVRHDVAGAPELDLAREIDARYPGDPGVVVALLMNLVTLRRGEGLFLPAGVLHAYLSGLGVELMAASDNVLRGGLTPKHIDVPELIGVLSPVTGEPPVIRPVAAAGGGEAYPVPVDDFSLRVARARPDAPVSLAITEATIALATAGEATVLASGSGGRVALRPGSAVLITADEGSVAVEGDGEVFLAAPGVPASTDRS